MKEIIKKIDEANDITLIAEILSDADNSQYDDHDWHNILMHAAKVCNCSVDTILAEVEHISGYNEWLASKAEEEYQAMMYESSVDDGCPLFDDPAWLA